MDPSFTAPRKATLGGGCFWCLEAVFDLVNGVLSVVPGYAGGHTKSPTYEIVCQGITGHAEVIQIEYDPSIISYRELLEIFFEIHDPTTLNRQGHDVGPQYRSIILYHDQNQREIAETMIKELNSSGKWSDPIVTEVVPLDHFTPAEEYHHKYFQKHPEQGYCQFVIAPKVRKFQHKFTSLIKKED